MSNCGIPFLAQWNTSLCYPLSWFYLLLPLPWSLNYFCLGHLVIAGLGMYFLALAWTRDRFAASIAGLTYGLNGFIFNCLMWTSNLAALAVLPWVIWLVERGFSKGGRHLLIAALAGAFQMLSGAPEIIATTWMIIGCVWIGRWTLRQVEGTKSFLRLCFLAFLALALSAIQLIPFVDLALHSSRKASAESAAWSMPAWGIANFFVPMFHCIRTRMGPYIQVNQQWTSSYYLGIGTMTLAILAIWKVRRKVVWFLGGLLLLGLFLALGENSAVYLTLAKAAPALAFIRYPIKFLSLAVFALPLLAAYAAAEFEPRFGLRTKALGIVTATTLCTVIAISCLAWLSPCQDEMFRHTLTNAAARAVFVILISAAFIALRSQSATAPKVAFGCTILFLFALDATTHTARQNPTVPNAAYAPIELEMATRPTLGSGRAMVSPRMQALLARSSTTNALLNEIGNRKSLFEDSNLIDGIPKVNGFFSLYLREQQPIDGLLYNPTNEPDGLIRFMGVTQASSPTEYWKWNARPGALRLITVGQTPVFATDDEGVKGIENPAFDPGTHVFLPPDTRPSLSEIKPSKGSVSMQRVEAQRLDATISAAESAICVIAQTYSPHWKAFIDSQQVPVMRANHGFQAVKVPAGDHHLTLVYRDWGFRAGMVISFVSLGLVALLWLLKRRSSE